MALLDQINEPDDLKKLDQGKLPALAEEIRKFILQHVSVTGGHLASNLGVVELTIALHYVYNSPSDKIIWDVGHQSYVHKILTSRKDNFYTLRSYGGLSGFPKRKESVHDIFETGHSSTSISAALGIARARDLKKELYHVIAVVGDGALTGGMAFEAMNDAGHSDTNLTVILNDNEMSISQNVGALATHLTRIRSNPRYNWLKKVVESQLRGLPLIGRPMANGIEKLKNSLKYLLVPGIIFEEMGFTYMGPVNGHDLNGLVSVFERAKKVKGPVLIHVITKKGKGYDFSETNPERYHGVPPFDLEHGCEQDIEANMTYSMTFGRHLTSIAEKNNDIVAITAAMPEGTGLTQFKHRFPERFFDVGIAEQHAVTLAAGMAANGLRPVVAIYSTFFQRAYDQVLHDVCQQNLPVIFALDRAGIVGEDGETHQGVFDISYLQHIPNITLMAPKNTSELRKMMDYALTVNGPVAIRYPRGRGGIAESLPSLPLRDLSWEILEHGCKVAVLAVGSMVEVAIQLSKCLKARNIRPTIINARVIKPLDLIMLKQLANEADLLVTLEDNVLIGGFGSSVVQYVVANRIDVHVLNFGIPDRFIEHGSIKRLREELKLDHESIADEISKVLAREEKAYAGFTQGTY